jgi:hypothetical protein
VILEIKGACNIIFMVLAKESAWKIQNIRKDDKCNLSFGPIIDVVYPLPREKKQNKRHKANNNLIIYSLNNTSIL